MISIGDSDWDDSDDEPVVTKPLTNGHNNVTISNDYSKEDIRTDTQDFYTFEDLQSATIRGNLELVKSVLDTGDYDVNAQLTSGWTLLMYAVEQGHHELVEYLISLGAKVDFDCQMFYPLMACFNKPYLDHDHVYNCVKLLLDNKAFVNVHDKYHVTPLMLCARHGYTSALELICQSNADVNKQDQQGWTALMHAANENKRSSVDTLIKYKASPYIATFDEQLTCADIAHNCGHQTLYQHLEKIISPDTDIFKPAVPLPDEDKENDVPTYQKMRELELFLTSQELGNLIPLFNEQRVTFEMLLTMNQKDLERVGISQMGIQQKLLTAIKGVHGSEFEMPDMSQSLYNLELNCRDCSKVLKIYTKHLKYLRATSEYLLRQFKGSSKLITEYPTNAPEDSGLIANFQNVHEIVVSLRDNVECINEVMSEKLGCEVVERGLNEQGGHQTGWNLGYFVVGVGIGALTSCAIMKNLSFSSFSKFSSQACAGVLEL